MELPSNMLTPSIFAEKAKEELEPLGVKVNIYDSDWIKDQKMNAFWSVAKGSTEEPKMVEMIYEVKGFTGRLSDVGGQRCPDSVQNYCVLPVGQNQVQVRNPDTR